MKPSFRNLFMKKLTRDRVVPIISASVSWLIFAMIGSGSPSLPKFASSRSSRAPMVPVDPGRPHHRPSGDAYRELRRGQ
jgi:hypothetical protein